MRWLPNVLAIWLGLLSGTASAVPAFDDTEIQSNGTFSTLSTVSFTYTPTGMLAGIACIASIATPSETVSSFTADGVAVPEVALSPFTATLSELSARLVGYYIGTGISTPSEAQTISMTRSGTSSARIWCWGVNADTDTQVQDTAAVSNDGATSLAEDLLSNGENIIAVQLFFNGDTTPANLTPNSGWTDETDIDLGAFGLHTDSYQTPTTSNISGGFTSTGAAEDVIYMGMSISEVSEPGGAGADLVTIQNLAKTHGPERSSQLGGLLE